MATANRRYADPLDTKPSASRGLPLTVIGRWEYVPAGDPVGWFKDDFKGDWLGAWRAHVAESGLEWPLVTDFVDEHWDESERDRVAAYLEQGLVYFPYLGIDPCRFCGVGQDTFERTDGVYLWPAGLSHYLRDHAVRPPVSVIRRIISTQAGMRPPPTEDEAWWTTLNNHDGMVDDVLPREWFTARVDKHWWKTATLDS